MTLSFQGPPNERLDALLNRQVPAATAWGVPLYIAEAFGFRKGNLLSLRQLGHAEGLAVPGGVSEIVMKFLAILLGTLTGEGPMEASAPMLDNAAIVPLYPCPVNLISASDPGTGAFPVSVSRVLPVIL
jgi:hypothetical protein